MGGEFAAVGLGLASALIWGGGDFCGGLATRRGALVPVLVVAQASGLVLLLLLSLATGERAPGPGALAWAVAAGAAGMVGIAALYLGLARGRAATVAPVSAVLGAGLPVLFAAATSALPGALQLAGFGVALAGIWLIAGSAEGAALRGGLGLALLAGSSFGCYFICMHYAAAEAPFWATAAARGAALALMLPALLIRRPGGAGLPRATLGLALLAGCLDAVGNACYALAGQLGRLDIAAVLASLFPASTVLLARIVLGERITPRQGAGLAAVLLAIGLIAA